ncbi:putative reverse transcriptase domain-containing protein [Tanacetum coccineum]
MKLIEAVEMAMIAHDSWIGGNKGTEGVVGLTQWFEKMEFVFHISNCTVACQIKFATCTLLGNALMWWNSYVKTIGHDASYRMPWQTLMKMLTDKYCPRGKIKKLEIEIMFPGESDHVEKYVGGLLDMIQGSVMASKPKTMQEGIKIANDLMDQKVRAYAGRQSENKRKFDNKNQAQQQPPKKQSVAIACTAGSGERKEYVGTLPLCNRCKLHHNGPCNVKCENCKKVGHMTRDCRNPAVLAIKGPPLAMNVGIKGTTRVIARNWRIKNMETKLNVLKHLFNEDEDVVISQQNYVVTGDKMLVSDEDVDYAPKIWRFTYDSDNKVILSEAKRSDMGDVDMVHVSDENMSVFDDGVKVDFVVVPNLKLMAKEIQLLNYSIHYFDFYTLRLNSA